MLTSTPAPPAPAAPLPAPPAGPAGLSVKDLAALTPVTRDRYVDFLRAVSIVVVVAWHWVFSITQWSDEGSLVMPNPIGDIPGMWLATWLLQIMPVFFFVGGFANLAGWEATARSGGGWMAFARRRLGRLLRPLAIYVGLWAVGDVVAGLVAPGYPGVRHWGMVVFVPLWFLGIYTGVVLLAPFTARAHRLSPVATIVLLGAGIAVSDAVRFLAHVPQAGLVTSALVWVFAHQLGYFWRDGTLVACARRRVWAVTSGGLGALVALTNLGPYPRSMVSLAGEGSNMFPTTACIAALAVFQIGVAMLVRPAAERWLQKRGPWTATIAVNAVAMTVFTWHMTALVAAIGAYQALGGSLIETSSATWWGQRPLWLVLPGLFLSVLVAVFARFERGGVK